jgi:multiple sugar transport system permease protein
MRPKLLTGKRRKMLMGILMLVPASVFILSTNLYPLVNGIVMTFHDITLFNINRESPFVGLRNYIELFNDDTYLQSLKFTIVYTASVVILSFLFGLGLALMANRKFRNRGLFRTVILWPWILPTVVAAVAWLWTFNSNGVINNTLKSLGWIDKNIPFFYNPVLARVCVIGMGVWKGFPFMVLTLLGGLQTIPGELYEASQIDGASKFQTLLRITLPMIKEISIIALLLRFIWTFNNYEQVFLLTQGGPLKSTMVFSIYSFLTAFSRNRLSYAATISVLMMILLLIGMLIYYLMGRKGKSQYG